MTLPSAVAIVTGATRARGIGAAICQQLAAQGADIFFTYYRPYDRQMPWSIPDDEHSPVRLEAQLKAMGVRAASLEVDLSDPQAYRTVLDAVEAALGAPTILVNCAAYSTHDTYQRLDAATLDAHYAVNVRSACLLACEFARRHGQRPEPRPGRIINISSGQALGPMPGELAYIASKGAIEAFTLTLAAEVGPLGITVNAINPGPVDTGYMDEALRADLRPRFALGRIGEPLDAARLVAFLASPEGGWITGQVIHSHGGFRP